jgi:hypothetical protein
MIRSATGPTICNPDPASLISYPNNQDPSLEYDGGGDVTNDGAHQYLYDAEGRVCAVQYMVMTLPAMMGYIYDAQGERVAKGTITSWSCDPSTNGFTETAGYVLGPNGEQMTEVDGGGNWIHTNLYAAGQLFGTYQPDGLHFHLSDWVSSSVQEALGPPLRQEAGTHERSLYAGRSEGSERCVSRCRACRLGSRPCRRYRRRSAPVEAIHLQPVGLIDDDEGGRVGNLLLTGLVVLVGLKVDGVHSGPITGRASWPIEDFAPPCLVAKPDRFEHSTGFPLDWTHSNAG